MIQKQWLKLTKHDQLLMIGSEILHANFWQKRDPERFKIAITRTSPLIDFSLEDPKWQEDRYVLSALQEELEKFQNGTRIDPIEILYQTL